MFRIQSALRVFLKRKLLKRRWRCSTTGTPCEDEHVHLGDEWAFLGLPEGGAQEEMLKAQRCIPSVPVVHQPRRQKALKNAL